MLSWVSKLKEALDPFDFSLLLRAVYCLLLCLAWSALDLAPLAVGLGRIIVQVYLLIDA